MSRCDSTPKVVVLGGSSAFTPRLALALARLPELPKLELALVGRHAGRTAAVAAASNAVAARAGVEHHYASTTSAAGALPGADLVLLQVRVGGFPGRAFDESFPLASGVVGDETLGPGGLSSILRSFRTVVDLGHLCAARAPEAPVLVLSNPLGMLVRALRDEAGVDALGLCELPGRTLAAALRRLGLEPRAAGLRVDYLGANHQGWFTRLELHGRDLLPELFDALEAGGPEPLLPIDPQRLRAQGALPLFYLAQFLQREEEVRRRAARGRTRALELADLATRLHARWAQEPEAALPRELSERDMPWLDEAVAPALAALLGGRTCEQYVSLPNAGRVPGVPGDAILEARARLEGRAVQPCAWSAEPPGDDARTRPLVAFLRRLAAFEDLSLAAAREPGAERVRRALEAHPLDLPGATLDALTAALVRKHDLHTVNA